MKPKMAAAYMATARIFAELSHARRLHVGAIVVKEDRIISIGYNGMPAGWVNDCEDRIWNPGSGPYMTQEEFDTAYPYEAWHDGAERVVRYGLKTKPEVLHAESNAVSKLARSSESGDGSTMFVTHAPCLDCAKLIYQSGIRRLFYGTDYRDEAGVSFLRQCGVDVSKVD